MVSSFSRSFFRQRTTSSRFFPEMIQRGKADERRRLERSGIRSSRKSAAINCSIKSRCGRFRIHNTFLWQGILSHNGPLVKKWNPADAIHWCPQCKQLQLPKRQTMVLGCFGKTNSRKVAHLRHFSHVTRMGWRGGMNCSSLRSCLTCMRFSAMTAAYFIRRARLARSLSFAESCCH